MKISILIVGLAVLVSVATACWAEKEETNNTSAIDLKHSIPSETIKYLSYNVAGFQEIFTDDYRKSPVTLKGHLYLPKGESPFPVVVLQHGTGSVENSRPWISKIVPVLNRNQLGVFVADSYSMRKTLKSCDSEQMVTSRPYRPVDHKVQYLGQPEPIPQSIQRLSLIHI